MKGPNVRLAKMGVEGEGHSTGVMLLFVANVVYGMMMLFEHHKFVASARDKAKSGEPKA